MILCRINVIEELRKAGYTPARLRKEKILGENIKADLRNNVIRKIDTLDKLCDLLECEPMDIIVYRRTPKDIREADRRSTDK